MPRTSSAASDSIRPLLRRIGLDDKEIEIYLAVLPLKMARATQVAKAAKQSRSHTYLILRSLGEKGLVSEIERGSVIHFVAEPPERLLTFVQDRERELKSLEPLIQGVLPMLSGLTSPLPGKPRVTMLQGLEGMRQIYKEILVHDFVGMLNAESMYNTFDGNIVARIFGQDINLRGRDLMVDNPMAREYIRDVPQHEDYEVRIIPKNIQFKTDTVIFGDVIALFAYDDESTIVRIENAYLADAFKAWFEVLWAMSSSSQKKK